MNEPFVEVYIMTRDRILYFNHALDSVLQLNYSNYKISISDNSLNNNVKKLIEEKNITNNNKINYIKRNNDLNLFEHVKLIFNESKSDYLVIFHDDDILEKDFLKISMPYFNNNKNLCAIGVNGITIDDDSNPLLKRKKMYNSSLNKIFKSPKTLLYQYFGYKSVGVCHHSGFVYDLKKVKKLINSMDFKSNSNSLDVYYLAQLLNYYEILYLAKPLMRVRFHNNNINTSQSFQDRLFILNKIRYELAVNDKFLLNSFRYCLYFFWKKNSFQKKKFIAKKLLMFRIKFIINFYLNKII